MRKTALKLNAMLLVLLAGCAMTQKPAVVSESAQQQTATPAVVPVVAPHADPAPVGSASVVPEGLALNKLPLIAKARQKSPMAIKQYLGQTLHGQGKFVKTAKGNPNAVVADVRVNGVGEVSVWCRNVLGAAPPNRVAGFEGTFTGDVYTSEDFSHDVTLKDCRFRD